MKRKNLFFAAALTLVAAAGAYASVLRVPTQYIYYSNNNPATGTPIEITLDRDCPQLGTGCTYQPVTPGTSYQLYKDFGASGILAVKP